MPLCNGVRPWIEAYPDKEASKYATQIYLSETTSDVMQMLKEEEEKPIDYVSRADLNKTPFKLHGQTKKARKELLDAIYGNTGDVEDPRKRRIGMTGDPRDKARFLQHTLGRKVTNLWDNGGMIKLGSGVHYENEGNHRAYHYPLREHPDKAQKKQEGVASPGKENKDKDEDEERRRSKPINTEFLTSQLKKIGDHDPALPDKRGDYRPMASMLPGSLMRKPSSRPMTAGTRSNRVPGYASESSQARGAKGDVQDELTLSAAIKASTPATLAATMMARGIKPMHAYHVIRDALKSLFDTPCFHVDRLHLSPGELIAVATQSETLHIPHHTERERTYLLTFRALCRIKLKALLKSEDRDDFREYVQVPEFSKEFMDATELCMVNKPPWQIKVLQTGFVINRMAMLANEVDNTLNKGQRTRSGFTSMLASSSQLLRRNSFHCLDGNAVHELDDELDALDYMSKHPLEPEWYDRLLILRRRDRRLIREDIDSLVHAALSVKRLPIEADGRTPSPDANAYGAVANFRGGSKLLLEPPKKLTKPVDPFTTRSKREAIKPKKPSPEEAELRDTPRYWAEPRLVQGGGDLQDDAPLTARGEKVLRALMRGGDEVFLKRSGPHGRGKSYIFASDLAAKALGRSTAKKEQGGSDKKTLEYQEKITAMSGIPMGRAAKDPPDIKGAARGAVVFRLVPSYAFHDKEKAQHPLFRPPSARLKTWQQFEDVKRVLETPHVDAHGNFDGDGPIISRPPTATPRELRSRLERLAEMRRQGYTGLNVKDRPASEGSPRNKRLAGTDARPPPGRPQSARPTVGARVLTGGGGGGRPMSAGVSNKETRVSDDLPIGGMTIGDTGLSSDEGFSSEEDKREEFEDEDDEYDVGDLEEEGEEEEDEEGKEGGDKEEGKEGGNKEEEQEMAPPLLRRVPTNHGTIRDEPPTPPGLGRQRRPSVF